MRATSEEDAAEKAQAEFDRPYGYFGSWKTTTSEIDVDVALDLFHGPTVWWDVTDGDSYRMKQARTSGGT